MIADGAGEIALAAMRDFPMNESVQYLGLCVLTGLQDASYVIIAAKVVMAAMKHCENDEDINFMAMTTMKGLITDDEKQMRKFIRFGAFEAIIKAMKGIPHSLMVQTSALAVMQTFILRCIDNQEKLVERGGVTAVLDLVRSQPTEWILVTATRIVPEILPGTLRCYII